MNTVAKTMAGLGLAGRKIRRRRGLTRPGRRAAAPDLVRKYGIDYVMIGPQEIPRGANRAYWEQHGTVVYDDGEYAVYRVR